ncbi:MAG TPA: hypothetical protein VF585_08670, partial [Chthoniobacterales bacterium]
FGTIYPGAPIADFATEAARYAQAHCVEVTLHLVGRSGPEQALWTDKWRGAGLKLIVSGEQTPEEVSKAMMEASVGIATTAFALVEKSGSVAAMREHGLPVICVSSEWSPRGMSLPEVALDVFPYRVGNFDRLMSRLEKPSASTGLADVARLFVENLASVV